RPARLSEHASEPRTAAGDPGRAGAGDEAVLRPGRRSPGVPDTTHGAVMVGRGAGTLRQPHAALKHIGVSSASMPTATRTGCGISASGRPNGRTAIEACVPNPI